MISLLSDACHSGVGQPDITPGNQAVNSRACFSLWVCSSSTCPGRQNGGAEPDTLQGSFPEARLPGVWAWEVVPPLLYETGQACLSATALQEGQSTVSLGHTIMECMGDLLDLGPLCYLFSENN